MTPVGSTGGVDERVEEEGVEEEGLLTFTEPDLALSLLALSVDEAEIRVQLSHEAAPPDARGDRALQGYSMLLRMTLAAVRAAADEWERQLAAFPTR